MCLEMNVSRSLPPLVQGRVHGYLKLVIDEIIWSRRSLGNVAVLASWWGELDSAQFRPVNIKTEARRVEEDIVETYAVRTNSKLFEEYLKNCETIELVIVSEKTHQVIGISHITELLQITQTNAYSRYFPILNDCGNRLGDLHVSIQLLNMTRTSKTIGKVKEFQRAHIGDNLAYHVINSNTKFNYENLKERSHAVLENKARDALVINNVKHQENLYKSILKDKAMLTADTGKKFNMEVTDKLVAQVVARAQRLRGAILKESREEDPLAQSESSLIDSSMSDFSPENEAKLYEYFLGNKMSHADERKALEALRTTSPTSSLINLASKTILSHQEHNKPRINQAQTEMNKPEQLIGDILSRESDNIEPMEETSLLDHVDCMKIIVESLTLTPAGYRRVRSSCVSRGDGIPMSLTYFVSYDAITGTMEKSIKMPSNTCRPTKLFSKKQVGQVIYFNHQTVHEYARKEKSMDEPLKFKIFYRHLNQRKPTELGVGSMHISDATENDNLNSTQKLAIVSKDIKMAELKVSIHLGCDRIHFGKNFVDAVMSVKENIPIYETSSSTSIRTGRCKTGAGSHSKSNSRVSSACMKQRQHRNSETSTSAISDENEATAQRQRNVGDRMVRVDTPDNGVKEKVLLHGLIYIAEGRGLPKSDSYLICRAFWGDDKASSQLCSNTDNPFYHFHELVPLLHGPDLLERTKDNCVVIEVWSRSPAGRESILGIAKLSVHQLYVAYRDPLIVPHLLLSKYPVISVDGWVPISDLATGQPSGQLLALVALGTADQIALLEMTRGLRDCAVTPRTMQTCYHTTFQNEKAPQDRQDPTCSTAQHSSSIIQNRQESSHPARLSNYSVLEFPGLSAHGRDFASQNSDSKVDQNVKNQESQTDITTVQEVKSAVEDLSQKSSNSVLHALVDHLAQALNVPKRSAEAQTSQQIEVNTMNPSNQTDFDPLRSNSIYSMESSPRDNFHLPTEIFRSVGVGAEFEETTNQLPSTSSINTNSVPSTMVETAVDDQLEYIATCSDSDNRSFRALVEIESALHLPKTETQNGAIEPSTYVTFQPMKTEIGSQFGPYMVTNVFPSSCSPKWGWSCDTILPTELLENDQKRMIMKIWRISDPNVSTSVNLDEDIVIGFAAVDLSILNAGLPLVSGWFHIMDFTGKCNGQIKISINPLENTSVFAKSTSAKSVAIASESKSLAASSPSQRTNFVPGNTSTACQPSSQFNVPADTNTVATSHSQLENDFMSDFGLGFGDVSMTFLSQSLKQKLRELDEITKRLQSRLHDVTNEDFDVDFDPDFDPNEPEPEYESNKNEHSSNKKPTIVMSKNLENWQPLPATASSSSDQSSLTNGNRNPNFFNEIQHRYTPRSSINNNATSSVPNLADTGYPTNSNDVLSQYLSNGHLEPQHSNGHRLDNKSLQDNTAGQPVRGAKMHINHLLDKLTSLTAQPPPSGNVPMKRNIHDFIASLRQNNAPDCGKCNREVNLRTVPTQTENREVQSNKMVSNQTSTTNLDSTDMVNANVNNNIVKTPANRTTLEKNRVSTMIREELVEEENNDKTEFDDLTTHLMTSNVRHMDLDTIFNPLLYQHLIPDVQVTGITPATETVAQDLENLNTSTNGIMIEELDNRYAETFNATINNGLYRLRNIVETDASLFGEGSAQRNVLGTPDNASILRTMPLGLSENIDGNFHVTVVHEPVNDDLLASNSTESTTTVSLDQSSIKQMGTRDDDTVSITSSASSAFVVSRQAPDGGNPVEETKKALVNSRQSDSQDSSTDN